MELDGDLVLIEAMAINIICRNNTALGNYGRINWKTKHKSTNGTFLQWLNWKLHVWILFCTQRFSMQKIEIQTSHRRLIETDETA